MVALQGTASACRQPLPTHGHGHWKCHSPHEPQSPLGWQDLKRGLSWAPGHVAAGLAPRATTEKSWRPASEILKTAFGSQDATYQLLPWPAASPPTFSAVSAATQGCSHCPVCRHWPELVWRGGQVGRFYQRAWEPKQIKNIPMLASSKSPRFVFSSSSCPALALLMHGVSRWQRVSAPKERTHVSFHRFFYHLTWKVNVRHFKQVWMGFFQPVLKA